MPIIASLAEAKSHLRVDNTDEDSLITIYIDAAETHVREFLNRDSIQGELDSPVSTPAPIKAAILLLIGDLYENRLGQYEVEFKKNPAVYNLLMPYRVGMGV